MAPDDRPTDEPPLAQPSTDLRARLLYDCFATPDPQLETTLPPDDPDADLTWRPLTFIWPTGRGVQLVIMPLWRRLD